MMSLSRIIKSQRVLIKPLDSDHNSSTAKLRHSSNPTVNLEAQGQLIHSEAPKKAQDLLQKAKKEAAQLIKDAQSKAQKLQKEAEEKSVLIKQKAQEEGHLQGEKEIVEKWENILQKGDQALDQVITDLKEWQESLMPEVLELSQQIAKRLIAAELKINPAAIINRVNQALQELTNTKEVLIKVAPTSYSILQQAKDELYHKNGGMQHLRFTVDEELNHSDFIIETDFGGINGRLETQLELMQRELTERLEADEK